jgi:hypothetical protein
MTMAAARRLLIAGFVLIASALSAQQVPVRDTPSAPNLTGTALLSGTVVNDVTNRPARRAVVTLSSSDIGFRVAAITDDTGTFAFRDLPEGRYFLGTSKAGYVSTSFGAKRPNRPGTTIALTTGQQRTGVTLRLIPGAVLTGTVRNRNGEPMPGVRVVALRPTVAYDTGERTLAPVAGGFGEETDDRGMYRIYALPPDDYFVVVTPGLGSRNLNELREITSPEVEWARRQFQAPGGVLPAAPTTAAQAPGPGRAVEYSPVFYPGAFSQATAGTVSLKAGEERAGVDVLLDLTPTAKITGTVVSPDGVLPPNLQVNVIAHDTIPGVPFSGFGTARVDKNGAFSSAGLPPGDYTVTVRVGAGARGAGPSAPASALFGATAVGVHGSDVDIRITLQPGVTLSGQLHFDATTLKPPADLSQIRVSLNALRSRVPSLGVPPATADATGAFKFVGVTPGRYRLSVSLSGGWQMRSAIVDGRDMLDTPLEIRNDDVRGVEIRFTDLSTEISGSLLDPAGEPAPEYFIILFPVDKAYWTPQSRRIQSTRPASDGRYRIQNLPPGEYLIAAVTDVEQGEWYDPAFLAQLVGASTKIVLTEGEKKVQSLKIGSR